MSTCPLCRVTKTEAHLESGWHKFNEKLFAEGKMPIPEANYNNFERHRHEGNTNGPITITPAPTDNHNVNKWHWEEFNLTNWAKKFMSRNIKAIEIPFSETGVIKFKTPKFTGDAYISTRKGRTFSGFEMKADISFTAKKDEYDGKGTFHLPEISADIDDFDYEIINIKVEGDSSNEKEAITKAINKEARKAISLAIKEFALEIKNIAKNPNAYDHDSLAEDNSDAE